MPSLLHIWQAFSSNLMPSATSPLLQRKFSQEHSKSSPLDNRANRPGHRWGGPVFRGMSVSGRPVPLGGRSSALARPEHGTAAHPPGDPLLPKRRPRGGDRTGRFPRHLWTPLNLTAEDDGASQSSVSKGSSSPSSYAVFALSSLSCEERNVVKVSRVVAKLAPSVKRKRGRMGVQRYKWYEKWPACFNSLSMAF